MSRKKDFTLLVAGILVGAALAPTAAHAVSELLTATPSAQTFYVGGKQVELEAYAINGHNYVKLRDIGQAVDFDVAYDAARNAVVMEPDKPYSGEDVAAMTTPTPKPAENKDYSAQANPAIFQGELSRENYNAIRDTVLHQDEIIAGSYQPIPMGAYTRFGIVYTATSTIGGYPVYEPISQPDGSYVCTAKIPESYKDAIEHTQGFVDGLVGLSDREKVTAMAWYVADRITYAVKYPTPNEVLAQDGQLPGACMSYAHSFRFLCDLTGIPCILKNGGNHQWNMVYVDGQWWDVDVTSSDVEDDPSLREYITILKDPVEHKMAGFIDEKPEVTAFAMELLVPGSTK